MTRVRLWLTDHGSIFLVAIGIVLVGLALWRPEYEALASVLVAVGAGCVVLGVLLDRLEGTIKLGPAGIELVLKKVEEEAEDRGLGSEEKLDAIWLVLNELHSYGGPQSSWWGRGTGKASMAALASSAVQRVAAGEGFEQEAAKAVRDAAKEIGAQVEEEATGTSARFDLILEKSGRRVGVEIKNSLVRGERSLQGQLLLALNQSAGAKSVLLILNADAVTEEDSQNIRRRLGKFMPSGWSIRTIRWKSGPNRNQIVLALQELFNSAT